MSDPDEAKQILDWMGLNGINPDCPECGKSRWYRGGGYRWGKLHGFKPGQPSIRRSGRSITPRTYLICESCAHVRVFPKLNMDFNHMKTE